MLFVMCSRSAVNLTAVQRREILPDLRGQVDRATARVAAPLAIFALNLLGAIAGRPRGRPPQKKWYTSGLKCPFPKSDPLLPPEAFDATGCSVVSQISQGDLAPGRYRPLRSFRAASDWRRVRRSSSAFRASSGGTSDWYFASVWIAPARSLLMDWTSARLK